MKLAQLHAKFPIAGVGTLSAIILLSAVLTACGGGGATDDNSTTPPSSTPPPLATGSTTLTWESPNQNVDESCLTNLSGYRVHRGASAGNYTAMETVSANNAALSCTNSGMANGCSSTVPILTCTYTVSNLPSGSWYFSVQAFNQAGDSSAYSGEIRKTVP